MFSKKSKNPRRNLSDQKSKRIYTYYSNTRLRNEEQTDRSRLSKAKDRLPKARTWWHHTPSILAAGAILICLGYSLSINSDPKVVQTGGGQGIFLRDKGTYETAANKIINSSLLNKNKVTINVSSISNDLKQQFPELSNVSVTIPLINRRPIIYVTASQPALVLVTENTSAVVDNRGVAVVPALQIKDLTKYNLLTVKDKSGLTINSGKSVLPGDSVKFITATSKQFTAENQQIDQITLPAIPNELDVKLKGQSYYIKMDMTGDSREQVGAYMAAISKVNSLNAQPGKYIDVRVVGRVFYQ